MEHIKILGPAWGEPGVTSSLNIVQCASPFNTCQCRSFHSSLWFSFTLQHLTMIFNSPFNTKQWFFIHPPTPANAKFFIHPCHLTFCQIQYSSRCPRHILNDPTFPKAPSPSTGPSSSRSLGNSHSWSTANSYLMVIMMMSMMAMMMRMMMKMITMMMEMRAMVMLFLLWKTISWVFGVLPSWLLHSDLLYPHLHIRRLYYKDLSGEKKRKMRKRTI